MRSGDATVALTVRLPRRLYDSAADVARKRRSSLNALVRESIEESVRAAEERERYDHYTLLGQDQGDCDVEYAAAAQAEVMLRDAP